MPFLRTAIFLVAGSNFAFSAIFLALIVRAKDLGASASEIGLMLAGSFWIWSASALVLPLMHNAFALGAVWGFAGIFGPVFNVTLASYRYALVPDRLLARAGSAALVVAWGAAPLGQITAGSCCRASEGSTPSWCWPA